MRQNIPQLKSTGINQQQQPASNEMKFAASNFIIHHSFHSWFHYWSIVTSHYCYNNLGELIKFWRINQFAVSLMNSVWLTANQTSFIKANWIETNSPNLIRQVFINYAFSNSFILPSHFRSFLFHKFAASFMACLLFHSCSLLKPHEHSFIVCLLISET